MKTKTIESSQRGCLLIEIPDQEYVYYIVDNHSEYATVFSKPLEWLELYKIQDLNK